MLPVELFLVTTLAAIPAAAAHPTTENASSLKLSVEQWSQAQLQPNHNPKQYQCFGGHLERYPDQKDWLSWSELWNISRDQILSVNGGDTYLQHYIQEAILKVADESNIDARILLVLIMQETNGHAMAPCRGTLPRCGIMHASKGHTFDASNPQESIAEMIREGVLGSAQTGPGYAQLLSGKPKMANVPKGNAFAAARAYNSGSVGVNLDEVIQGQASYVNDVAARLLGWDGRGKGFESC